MTLNELCQGIRLQPEAASQVITLAPHLNTPQITAAVSDLLTPATWEEGRNTLKQLLAPDPEGFKMLTCMLSCALTSHCLYRRKGISDKIFFDTFRCFTRFIEEHRVSFGVYGFDRDFWTMRQLSLKLFRLGELEYEMKSLSAPANPVISLHIPSDARLTEEGLSTSLKEAREFFHTFFPEFHHVRICLNSWLLSPALKHLLPEDSHILQFQKHFTVERVDEASTEFMVWVFKNPRLSLAELPEHTSLQKSMKKYLLRGGRVGSAFGYIKGAED